MGGGYIRRADTGSLRAVFDKYASLSLDGQTYMTDEDFVIKYLVRRSLEVLYDSTTGPPAGRELQQGVSQTSDGVSLPYIAECHQNIFQFMSIF